jgi:glucosamine--fructose-6-phosphate aminotransferase (isomerizing)
LGGAMNPYVLDILAQPAALRAVVNKFSPKTSVIDHPSLKVGRYDRIILTGMGASFNAAYPAYMQLTELPLPVMLVNTAELVHYLGGAIGERTLLWINSQSGRSAEVLHLLEQIQSNPPAYTLAFVNDETSPLATAAEVCLPIHAGSETSVSTKTYLNTLAVNLLLARKMAGYEIEDLKQEILSAADAIEAYLNDWQARVEEMNAKQGNFENVFIIGRGSSMSAVWNGALINKEAARCAFEGVNAADFRHGPMELVGPGLCAWIYAGHPSTAGLNRKLALDIIAHQGRVVWLDIQNDTELATILVPETSILTRPLGEILPMQLLTLAMARRKGITPGDFQVVEKVTAIE